MLVPRFRPRSAQPAPQPRETAARRFVWAASSMAYRCTLAKALGAVSASVLWVDPTRHSTRPQNDAHPGHCSARATQPEMHHGSVVIQGGSFALPPAPCPRPSTQAWPPSGRAPPAAALVARAAALTPSHFHRTGMVASAPLSLPGGQVREGSPVPPLPRRQVAPALSTEAGRCNGRLSR